MARIADRPGRQRAQVTTMQPHSRTALILVNADTGSRTLTSLRIEGSRISAVGCPSQRDDRVLDLRGDRLLPGLINAHDHLQLNSLPRVDFHKRYHHVREWIADVNALRWTDPPFRASVDEPRDERLLIGGLKNLLSGVTTVAHHDPLYPSLWSVRYPTRVVLDGGWSHSLYLDGEEQVFASQRSTPSGRPWIIHACEGVDEAAVNEFERLESLGCVKANTLIVHGIALDRSQQLRLAAAGAGLIWCPASNLRLFGKTAEVSELAKLGRVALGTDSRLSGSRDLLDELRIASEMGAVDERLLEQMVTRVGASLLRLPDRGELRAGALADLLVLPAGTSLSRTDRRAVRMVFIDGEARYGDPDLARMAGLESTWTEIRVDGCRKMLNTEIAVQLRAAHLAEPGLELSNAAWKAA